MSWNFPYPKFDPFYEDRVFNHCARRKRMTPAWLKNLSDAEIVRHFRDSELTELEADLIRRLAHRCNEDESQVPTIVRKGDPYGIPGN